MLDYTLSNDDLRILQQKSRKTYIKIQLLNEKFKPINELKGVITNGDLNITTSSMIRRTCNFTIHLNKASIYLLEEKQLWFTSVSRIFIGYWDYHKKNIHYYDCGTYIMDKINTSISGDNSSLKIDCLDLMGLFTKEHRGQIIGAKTIKFPMGYNIRKALIDFIALYGITNYYIEEIGIYYDVETDNTFPYDLEFDGDTDGYDIIEKIIGLYPYYEAFFDGTTFICKRIQTKISDPVILTHDVFSKYIISENVDYRINDVYNIVEVWGNDIDYDRFSSNVSMIENKYSVIFGDDIQPSANVKYAIMISETNIGEPMMQINGSPFCYIVNPDGTSISKGYLEKDNVYVFKYLNNKFYLQGSAIVHSVALLLSKEPPNAQKKIYEEKFNCRNISYSIEPDSNFTIEKIGEKKIQKTGGEYDNITSDYLCVERAKYDLYKFSKLTDTIELEMRYMPFLSVGHKVEYKPVLESNKNQYLLTDISVNISDGIASTMNVNMTRFYNFYDI